jgi:hypothetical protein
LTELDLEYQPEKKVYMFLAMFYAIYADVDINSEQLRWMGDTRFTFWAAYRIVNTKVYPSSFTYNGCEIQSKHDKKTKEDLEPSQQVYEGFKSLTFMNNSHVG